MVIQIIKSAREVVTSLFFINNLRALARKCAGFQPARERGAIRALIFARKNYDLFLSEYCLSFGLPINQSQIRISRGNKVINKSQTLSRLIYKNNVK